MERVILRHLKGSKASQLEEFPLQQFAELTIGRDPNSSLVIDAEWVSRNHASIEFKRGYFMIGDRSTNGTFVRLGEDEELRLHRDEIHLRKSGTVSLGQAGSINTEHILYYQCSP